MFKIYSYQQILVLILPSVHMTTKGTAELTGHVVTDYHRQNVVPLDLHSVRKNKNVFQNPDVTIGVKILETLRLHHLLVGTIQVNLNYESYAIVDQIFT